MNQPESIPQDGPIAGSHERSVMRFVQSIKDSKESGEDPELGKDVLPVKQVHSVAKNTSNRMNLDKLIESRGKVMTLNLTL